MTGIERLYKLIADIDVSADPELWDILRWGTEGDWDCEKNEDKTLGSALAAIAIQTIAWVRDHGGLDAVKRRWECLSYYADPVPRSCMEKRLARLQRQIDESHAALRRRNKRIEELNHRSSDLTRENAKLRKRAMPEGFEWPRFESGEPVMLGDSVVKYVGGGEFEVRSIEFRDGVTYLREGFRTEGIVIVRPCERVKRPAPKVLDADGVEIREGDRVWSTQLDEPHEWIVINPHEDRGDSQTVLVSIGDRTGHARPENLTHRAPVLAADGEPLEVGQTVWDTDAEADTPLTVVEVSSDLVRCEYTWKDGKTYRPCYQPDQLTHERPDTWERIKEDAGKNPFDYCKDVGHRLDTCENAEWYKARDLVRRAKKLAGVDND